MIKLIIDRATQPQRHGENHYVLPPHVVLVVLHDGTGRLVDLGGNFYALSQTAVAMLCQSLQTDPSTVARAVTATHHADLPQVERDLTAFLHDLERRELLYSAHQRRRARPPKFALSSHVLRRSLHIIRTSGFSLQKKSWTIQLLAYFSLRLHGWPTTVRTWQCSSRQLPTRATGSSRDRAAREIDGVTRAVAAHHWLPIECKERALCCWVLGRWAGLPVKLIVGIDPWPLTSHCWCELDDVVMTDPQDTCDRFTPVATYD